MPTIINNPETHESSGTNFVLGIILAIIVFAGIILFFVYGLPAMRDDSAPQENGINLDVRLPDNNQNSAPQQ